MATSPKSGAVTLLDFAKSIDPNGRTATVVELLNQTNEMLIDMMWIEGNLPTGHRSTIRTGLPTATFRQMYGGVQPSKSQRAQVDDSCGMLETRSEVDKDVAELNGNTNEFRLSEADSFIESMNQTMAGTMIYGDTTINPERFTGFAPRFNSLEAGNGGNIIDAGGTGSDNTSVWLVIWGAQTVHGIFPKGSKAGLLHQDLGEIDAFDNSQSPPGRYRAYADRWQWKCGLRVADWRYVVRIANIDVSDLAGQTGTQAITGADSTLLIKMMIKAMARIPSIGKGRACFYASRTVKEMLSIQALDKSQNALALMPGVNQFGAVSPGSVGNGILTFFGVPVRTVDQILLTEARIT